MTTPRRQRITFEDIGDVTVVKFVDKKILDEQNIQAIGDDLFKLVDELGRRKLTARLRPSRVPVECRARQADSACINDSPRSAENSC